MNISGLLRLDGLCGTEYVDRHGACIPFYASFGLSFATLWLGTPALAGTQSSFSETRHLAGFHAKPNWLGVTVRAFAGTKFDGVISLSWVMAWAVIFYACGVARRLQVEHFMLLFIALLALWWGVGLLFAISALRRGSALNFVCGLVSVIGFVGFLGCFLFPIQ